ncbi:MAG: threonylcarbamoyl-AMP synthase [Omnitrophica WOR_2 bacterium RIFCSPHIGHO2_01_FULL_48_9]|nr:MAG: threonylcarbamoyl-AMP synthase [Omnitrophica WOR_2 bacterium RIFCSPHIGHO2_02_FULL_48_11]OGX31719.1 MAG: threonylcarbamoyl-AMP synthase [Omnitrophica WOR_2 bacterium RIFCSPHIGHO2_01_FULL_48_9]
MQTEIIKVHPHFPEIDQIAYCAKIIRQGGLVIFPTETVYGIAADFNNPKAMARLREVKRRSPQKPFSIMIPQKGLIANYTSSTDPKVYKLIDQYWPGPLTVIVPSADGVGTIGIRMPDHAIALKLVQEAQCTIAAPSANIEGRPAPKTCQEALKDLNGLVNAAIDGGEAHYGQGSSVVDFTKGKPTVEREGAVRQSDVDQVTQRKTVLFVCTGNSCRSVMAEYYLRKMVGDRDDIEIISAGTGVYIRSSASSETINVLRKEGADASMHVSQPLNMVLLKKSDLILVMTKNHRQQVLDWAPSVEKRVYLLREFSSLPLDSAINWDIPDPIGKPAEAYEECLLTIKDCLNKVVKLI